MLQIDILNGKMAGTQVAVRHFPFRVGRSSGNDLRLDETGIWAEHVQLEITPELKFLATFHKDALGVVNGVRAQSQALRNGDTLDLGVIKLQVWLSAPTQKSFRFREVLTFGMVVIVAIIELSTIYYLVR